MFTVESCCEGEKLQHQQFETKHVRVQLRQDQILVYFYLIPILDFFWLWTFIERFPVLHLRI